MIAAFEKDDAVYVRAEVVRLPDKPTEMTRVLGLDEPEPAT